MTFCVIHRLVGGKKIEEAGDGPYLMEQKLKFCYCTSIACLSYNIVTSWTL
ncbi:hypothetical protein DPMN_132247 [Dreissena polymorpha]|uniref:Uncharacterized protein n=1 Tax=Dreissena polymorpha TaxID=45954 RepID=A0A9D4J9X3_DREPO|nr:hypothetical protein DPMN_132247 [Dreissena polymorpha]